MITQKIEAFSILYFSSQWDGLLLLLLGFFDTSSHISPACLFPGWPERLPDCPGLDDRRTPGAHLQPITHTFCPFYKILPRLILHQFVANPLWYSLAHRSFILVHFMIPVSCANLIISPTDRPSRTPVRAAHLAPVRSCFSCCLHFSVS